MAIQRVTATGSVVNHRAGVTSQMEPDGCGNRAVLRIAGVVGVLAALTLLVSMGVFTVDMMQMRAVRVAEAQAAVLAGGLFQDIKYLIASLVLGCLGLGSLRTAKNVLADER